ncbi:unnamed protein product [Ascophyllum nodosum]
MYATAAAAAVMPTRTPLHTDVSSSIMGDESLGRKGGHDACWGCDGGCDGCCGGVAAGRYHPATNRPSCTSSRCLKMKANHLEQQQPSGKAAGDVGMNPLDSASQFSLAGIISPTLDDVTSQAQQSRCQNQNQGTRTYATSTVGGVSGAALINKGICTSVGYGQDVPFYPFDERVTVGSITSSAIGAGSAVKESMVSTVMAVPAVGVDVATTRPEACSTSALWPVPSAGHNNTEWPVWAGINSNVGEGYQNGASQPTAAKRLKSCDFEAQGLGSSFPGNPPIRPHDAGTPSPYDATAVAVGSQIMAAAGRLSAALGADGGESFLSGLTPPVAATCTPSYSPLLPGASSAGTGTGGGTSGSKGMTSSKSAFELTQPDFGFFSMAQRSLSDGRTGAVASGNGIVYGSDDFSTQASGQPKPSLTSCRREDNRSRSADYQRVLTPEEKLERSRIRNRDHSRKSRQRKKAHVEGMKKQVMEMGAYRMLVEQAHDLISAHTTDARALFLYASEAFQRLLGINPQDLIGAQLAHIVHREDVLRVSEAIRCALVYNKVTQVRYRLRYHSSGQCLVETSFRMVPTRLLAVTRVYDPTASGKEGARR